MANYGRFKMTTNSLTPIPLSIEVSFNLVSTVHSLTSRVGKKMTVSISRTEPSSHISEHWILVF